MKHSNFLFPAFVVCTALVWLAYAAMPPTDPVDGFHLNKFAMIPVQENGRLMPFDTFARTKLMMLNHRQDAVQVVLSGEENALLLKKAVGKITAEEEAALEQFETARNTAIKNGDKVKVRTVPAHEWALNTMMLRSIKINPVDEMYIFRIDNDQLLAFLDLKPSRQFGLYYKLSDFDSNNRFWERFREIHNNKGVRKGDILDAKIADLANKIDVIMRLAQFDVPFLVPPKMPAGNDQDIAEEKWLTLSAAAAQLDQGNVDPAFLQISQTLRAFMKGDKAAFNTALDRYLNMVNDKYPGVASKMQTEYRFNHFAPYVQCITLFICVLIMAVLSWVVWHQPLRYAAWSLGILTMILYTWTLVVRVQISGYAPVTNLYSSAVFIGWGCAGLCLLLELILRNGIGSAIAAVMGTIALIIAHNLLDGDSMGKLVAVLESNFWLSTHVICITFGYTATFVAGFLAICYVGLGIFTPMLRRESGVLLGKVLYGVICFAMFLSFVGTVLGGIWADQSWGRFWGWDPKENGALLIVIWNALILHARWAGLVKTRGVAMLAIFGNAVTAWSWFGTNFLGVGLHSYGFAEGGQARIFFFTLSQLALIAVAAIPLKYWVSFQPEKRLNSVA